MAADDREARSGSANAMSLEDACSQVTTILVQSFGLAEAEARQRVTLWRARQHSLEGQTLEALLFSLSPEERAQRLFQWALQGAEVENGLVEGAAELGIDLARRKGT